MRTSTILLEIELLCARPLPEPPPAAQAATMAKTGTTRARPETLNAGLVVDFMMMVGPEGYRTGLSSQRFAPSNIANIYFADTSANLMLLESRMPSPMECGRFTQARCSGRIF